MNTDEPYFCICSEEMCWCTNKVGFPDWACADCDTGKHVMEPPSELLPGANR